MASPAAVDAFRALQPDKQKDALGRMSPEAKQALLDAIKGAATETTSTGITVPKGMVDDDSSAVSGFFKRGRDTIKGAYETVAAPPTEAERKEFPSVLDRPALIEHRIAKGTYEGEKEAAGQVKEQAKTAAANTDPMEKTLGYMRAAVTAASMANPLATGSVTNVNKLEDEGRNREAIGQGTFDALSLLIGMRSGEPSAAKTTNKLAYATDTADVPALRTILPDIKETVAQTGKPATIGQLQSTIQTTMKRLDQQFNTALTGAKGTMNVDSIANALEAKANTLPPTTEGQAIAGQLRAAATDYRKPWTVQELNSERMFRNAQGQGFYGKSGAKQMAGMRSSADTMIDKIVADESRDLLYNELERQFPGGGFRELKRKQSSLISAFDGLDDHIKELEARQARRVGAPLSEKVGISTSVHAGGATPRVHVTELLKKGPLTHADTAVRGAFSASPTARTVRAAVLGLPLSSLVKQTGKTETSKEKSDDSDEE